MLREIQSLDATVRADVLRVLDCVVRGLPAHWQRRRGVPQLMVFLDGPENVRMEKITLRELSEHGYLDDFIRWANSARHRKPGSTAVPFWSTGTVSTRGSTGSVPSGRAGTLPIPSSASAPCTGMCECARLFRSGSTWKACSFRSLCFTSGCSTPSLAPGRAEPGPSTPAVPGKLFGLCRTTQSITERVISDNNAAGRGWSPGDRLHVPDPSVACSSTSSTAAGSGPAGEAISRVQISCTFRPRWRKCSRLRRCSWSVIGPLPVDRGRSRLGADGCSHGGPILGGLRTISPGALLVSVTTVSTLCRTSSQRRWKVQ